MRGGMKTDLRSEPVHGLEDVPSLVLIPVLFEDLSNLPSDAHGSLGIAVQDVVNGIDHVLRRRFRHFERSDSSSERRHFGGGIVDHQRDPGNERCVSPNGISQIYNHAGRGSLQRGRLVNIFSRGVESTTQILFLWFAMSIC